MSRFLYLDNAATTKTAPEVLEAMLPYFTEKFGNPSSVYQFAAENKTVVDEMRKIIAESLEQRVRKSILLREALRRITGR